MNVDPDLLRANNKAEHRDETRNKKPIQNKPFFPCEWWVPDEREPKQSVGTKGGGLHGRWPEISHFYFVSRPKLIMFPVSRGLLVEFWWLFVAFLMRSTFQVLRVIW